MSLVTDIVTICASLATKTLVYFVVGLLTELSMNSLEFLLLIDLKICVLIFCRWIQEADDFTYIQNTTFEQTTTLNSL